MSKILVPNIAERNLLAALVNWWSTDVTLEVALFTNDFTPDEDTIFADFVEPALAGYAVQTPGSWSTVDTDPDGLAYSLAATVTFTASAGSPVTVYGYFVTDDSSNLLWAERWDASRTFGPANSVGVNTLMRLRQVP